MANKQIRLAWVGKIGVQYGTGSDTASPAISMGPCAETLRMMEGAGVEFVALKAHSLTFNPSLIAPILGVAARKIGIVPSLSTSEYPPYTLARLIRSLDHCTDGRIGWGVDMGEDEGEADYDREEEYLSVCRKLWQSWPQEAMIEDYRTGDFADPDKVKPINHVGQYFKVAGPLSLVPSIQKSPLIVVFAGDEKAFRFAGKQADVAFIAEETVEACISALSEIHKYAAEAGRNPGDVKVYMEICPFITEDPGIIPPKARQRGLFVKGNAEEVASAMEEAFDRSGCDGIALAAGWRSTEVLDICNKTLAYLRRRGRLVSINDPLSPLQERIMEN
ncbi:MAG: LLM class flavin-dependent oxidoreductase [Sphingobium sp.]